MWLVATYRPTALFSQKSSMATSSGARTNLVPTPYSIKLALVEAAFRSGLDGKAVFSWVKPLTIYLEPPEEAVVNHTFVKVLREPHDKKSGRAFDSTIAYREYAFFRGCLRIAFRLAEVGNKREELVRLLAHVQYLGKRGSFVQFCGVEELAELPPSFTWHVLDNDRSVLTLNVVFQPLDDVGPSATFDRVNTYSDERLRIGKDRIFVPTAIPYRLVASSRGYSHYRRVNVAIRDK